MIFPMGKKIVLTKEIRRPRGSNQTHCKSQGRGTCCQTLSLSLLPIFHCDGACSHFSKLYNFSTIYI